MKPDGSPVSTKMTQEISDVAAKVAERMGWVSSADLAEAESICDALAGRGVRKPLLEIAVERGFLTAERRSEAERLAEVAREIAAPKAPAPPPPKTAAPPPPVSPPPPPPVATAPPAAPAAPAPSRPSPPPPRPAIPPEPAFLRIAPTEGEGGREVRISGDRLLVGRAPDCGVVLSSTKVSARHAEIAWRDGRWWVRDLGSVNGCRLNGKPVQASPLAPGDEIRIYPYRISFSPPPGSEPAAPVPAVPAPSPDAAPKPPPSDAAAVPPPAPTDAKPAAPPSPPAPPPSLEGSGVLRLVFLEEGSIRRQIDLERFPAAIGSGEGNAVVLRHPDIAPVEAEIQQRDGKFVLVSKPGGIVRVKGDLLKHDRPLQAGDTIEIGPFQLECQGKGLPLPASPSARHGALPPPPMTFSAMPDWKYLIGIPVACAVILTLTLLVVLWLKSKQKKEMRPPPPPQAGRLENGFVARAGGSPGTCRGLFLESSGGLRYKPAIRKARFA